MKSCKTVKIYVQGGLEESHPGQGRRRWA